MVGYDTLSRIYEQMCSYSRAWTYTLNRQATYEWTYSLLSISNAMDYPTHYFMPSIDSFYDERLCQSSTRICSRNVTMEYQCFDVSNYAYSIEPPLSCALSLGFTTTRENRIDLHT